MRIQHNIMAMNAYRNYNTNTSALSKNLEKLSSGYKINRAGDDAAGLAISEKMRAQITGLNAAQKNVKDGISLVKTAEGAMQEIQDMLNRMDYLATQSANGTYDNEVDRANLQKEVDALKTEINRIADSANFNGIKLLNGDLAKADAVEASSTTTKNVYSGMDRIITSVLGKDDVASIAAGKKTIFDTVVEATKAVKASFSIDLTTLEFTGVGTGTLGAVSFTLQIGGVNLTVEATGIKATMTSSQIATKIAAAVASKAGKAGVNGFERVSTKNGATGVAINGVDWKVSAANGKLTFTQKLDPTTQDEARANFDVNITFGGKSDIAILTPALEDTDKKDITMSASLNAGTKVETAGVALSGANKANTVFNITMDDIKDGTQIAIGSKVILLKVGDTKMTASQVTKINGALATGQTLVLVTIGATDDLNTALSKISAQAGSTVNLTIATKGGGKTTVEFELGVSDGANGNVTGLTIQRVNYATQADQAFDSLEKLANNFAMRVTTTTNVEAQAAKDGLTLQIGDTSDKFNQMSVVIGDMHTTGMGIQDVDISNAKSAAEAVQTIKDAINYVSGIRGDLGAVQNRLEHTANNLSVMAENIQDAESTIRDTDIAEEMMSYTKNNILIQSAQAMLAQANAVPQGVLQLLG